MSNDLTTIQTKDLLSQGDITVLKQSKFKNFTDAEVSYACTVSKHLQLNPLLNQIHFVKRKNRDDTYTITTQVGIDGFRLAALRAGGYAGSDDAIFEGTGSQPTKATVTVYRMVSGTKCAFTASARWSEYAVTGAAGQMWAKMPFNQLAKCAEALALRKAFPQELAGLRTDEEMQQADAAPSKASALNARANTVEQVEEAEVIEENLGDFICNVGKKYKGKKLSEISNDELANFVMWIEEQEKPSKDFIEFAEKAKAYLG